MVQPKLRKNLLTRSLTEDAENSLVQGLRIGHAGNPELGRAIAADDGSVFTIVEVPVTQVR